MGGESHTKLSVIVHENNEITVKEGRGYPHLCRDCRFSGWLTAQERKESRYPVTCLFTSGGADTEDGDRIIFDLKASDFYSHPAYLSR